MSRRGIVILALILIAIVAVFLFQKKDAAVLNGDESAEETEAATTPSGADSSADVRDRKVSSSKVQETSSSSSDPSMQTGRGARSDRPLKKKTYSTQGAKSADNALLAGTSWKVWVGVSAYRKSSEGPPADRFLGEVSGFYLVEDGSQAQTEQFDPSKPIVVIDPSNQTAGVLTGTFSVRLEEGANADFLTQSESIKVIAPFPDINTYYVTSSQVPFNLKVFQDSLKAEPEVQEVKPEILSRQYEKL